MNKLYIGDVIKRLELLQSDSVDVGVTSPPYNKQENKKGWLVKNVKYDRACDKQDESLYQKNQIEVLNELFRIIKPGGSFFYNHKTRWEKGEMRHPLEWIMRTKWVIRQEIIWDRIIAANIRGWRFWQNDERIYWLYKPIGNNKIGEELLSKHALVGSIWRFPPEKKNSHPAPFPLILPLRAIFSVLDINKGVVIDPYCGSGTTLVAAKLLGHDYIGIDISKEYIKKSRERLNNYKKEIHILNEEIKKHVVKKTFSQRKIEGLCVGKFRKTKKTSFMPDINSLFNFESLN